MAGRMILVVEDDPGVRATVDFILKDEGFDVALAEDGESALAMARSSAPDLILLDNLMPGLDGPQVLAALRADPQTASIPVVAMTGMTPEASSEWSGVRLIQKPFSPDELTNVVTEVLGS